jgi:hypothetical protein
MGADGKEIRSINAEIRTGYGLRAWTINHLLDWLMKEKKILIHIDLSYGVFKRTFTGKVYSINKHGGSVSVNSMVHSSPNSRTVVVKTLLWTLKHLEQQLVIEALKPGEILGRTTPDKPKVDWRDKAMDNMHGHHQIADVVKKVTKKYVGKPNTPINRVRIKRDVKKAVTEELGLDNIARNAAAKLNTKVGPLKGFKVPKGKISDKPGMIKPLIEGNIKPGKSSIIGHISKTVKNKKGIIITAELNKTGMDLVDKIKTGPIRKGDSVKRKVGDKFQPDPDKGKVISISRGKAKVRWPKGSHRLSSTEKFLMMGTFKKATVTIHPLERLIKCDDSKPKKPKDPNAHMLNGCQAL